MPPQRILPWKQPSAKVTFKKSFGGAVMMDDLHVPFQIVLTRKGEGAVRAWIRTDIGVGVEVRLEVKVAGVGCCFASHIKPCLKLRI
jgi:hypothetical protein